MFLSTALMLTVLTLSVGSAPAGLNEVMIIVSSQSRSSQWHLSRQEAFKEHLREQIVKKTKSEKDISNLTVLFSGEEFRFHGHWLFLPVMELFLDKIKEKNWVIICYEETRFDIFKLLELLGKEDSKKPLFLGHALYDKDMTIIHHFHETKLPYPDLFAGAILSRPLITRILKQPLSHDYEFRIDIQHELARFILTKSTDNKNNSGVSLENRSYLCVQDEVKKSADCASWLTPEAMSPTCQNFNRVRLKDVVFAVKTCKQHFKDRIPVLKRTWSKDVKNIFYFAEVEDKEIPTVNQGVPNTEHGHCGKFISILKFVHKHKDLQDKKWLVVADDDTLLSIPRLLKVLRCYNQKNNLFVIGERYGYGSLNGQGSDYPTGGSGIVMSMKALRMLMEDPTLVRCDRNDEPDDMSLGVWLHHTNIPLIHSYFMHQARPMDYAVSYLSHQIPVSLHKFWECNPDDVYKKYLKEDLTPEEHEEL